MKSENVCLEKSSAFAIRIVNLYNYLKSTKREFTMSHQLLRSGTSIGANVAEAEFAISREDFINKMHISLKEASETLFWLSLLNDTGYIEESGFKSIAKDCEEIIKILISSLKTAKDKQKKRKVNE